MLLMKRSCIFVYLNPHILFSLKYEARCRSQRQTPLILLLSFYVVLLSYTKVGLNYSSNDIGSPPINSTTRNKDKELNCG